MRLPLILSAAALTLSASSALALNPPPFGAAAATYLCHNITGAQPPAARAVAVEQFGKTAFEFMQAVKICNPILEGEIQDNASGTEQIPPTSNSKLHYICYRINISQSDAFNNDFQVENQAETQRYAGDQPVEVCLPTLKDRL